jgi:hypothetical protein
MMTSLADVTAKTVIFESYADAWNGTLIQINEPSGKLGPPTAAVSYVKPTNRPT